MEKDPRLTFRLRRVAKKDESVLFEWRNDTEARISSRHTAPISWQEHQEWFEKTLHGDFAGRISCMAELADGDLIGVVRADPRSDGFFEISYTVAPKWRGKGVAKAMTQRFAASFLKGKKIAAIIKRGSVASEKVAEALGLSPSEAVPSEDPADLREFIEWR